MVEGKQNLPKEHTINFFSLTATIDHAFRSGDAFHVCRGEVRPQPDGIPGLHDGGRWSRCFARGCRDGAIPSILVSCVRALAPPRESLSRREHAACWGKGGSLERTAESTQGPAPSECWCETPAGFPHVCVPSAW